MAFTDEQFNRFMDALIGSQEQRDLLIRIDENTKNFRKEFEGHLLSDAANFSKLEQSTTKLHERIDEREKFDQKLKTWGLAGLFVLNAIFFVIVNIDKIGNVVRFIIK